MITSGKSSDTVILIRDFVNLSRKTIFPGRFMLLCQEKKDKILLTPPDLRDRSLITGEGVGGSRTGAVGKSRFTPTKTYLIPQITC